MICLFITFLDSNYLLPGHPIVDIKLSDLLLNLSLVTLIIGFFSFIGLSFASLILKRKIYMGLKERSSLISNKNINFFSNILFFIFILSILFAFIPSFPYYLRVITLSFDFLPLFVGFFYQRLTKKKQVLWIILFGINMGVHFVQGSRGFAIIPIALWVIGYLISINDKPFFKKYLILTILIFLPLLSLFGRVASFREYFGRGVEVNKESIGQFFDYLFIRKNVVEIEDNQFMNGLSRFLNVGDLAVLSLTPNIVDYRGWIQFGEELNSIYKLYGSEESVKFGDVRGNLKYGSGVLSAYGFSVNATTSVGLGLLGDSYSRFGYLGVVFYFLFMSLFLTFLEIKIINIRNNNLLFVGCFLFYVYVSLYTLYGNSYFLLFKKLIYNGMLVYLFFFIFTRFEKLKYK